MVADVEASSNTMTTPTRPGKSAQAVGQMAKAAVAEARAAGVEMPKNAQGMAASAIARGADSSSVFLALVQPDPITDDGAASDASGEEVAVRDAGEVSSAPAGTADAQTIVAAEEGYAAAADATASNMIKDEAETALALLTQAA